MINFYDVTGENIKEHNPNWAQISLYHPYRILVIGNSGSGKTNALPNLISHQPNINKIYLHAQKPYEAKYHLVISRCESVGLKQCNDLETFTGYSDDMDDIYENFEEYNQN